MERLNGAAKALVEFDWDGLDDLKSDTTQLEDSMTTALGINYKLQFKTKKVLKEQLAEWLQEAVNIVQQQSDMILKFETTVEQMKIELIADQAKLITAQDKLLQHQQDQLFELKSAVKTTVQDTVQEEIKTYSEAVGSQNSKMEAIQVEESVKLAVKSAIREDDRSKNVMIFGLAETENEQISNKVADLFDEIGENTRVSASRVGVKKSGSTPGHRPVKCTLTSSTAVHQILLKSRQLKLLDTYKSVFICPDRTPEERAARRALVAELKAANTKQPNHRHYIKHGKVHSSEA